MGSSKINGFPCLCLRKISEIPKKLQLVAANMTGALLSRRHPLLHCCQESIWHLHLNINTKHQKTVVCNFRKNSKQRNATLQLGDFFIHRLTQAMCHHADIAGPKRKWWKGSKHGHKRFRNRNHNRITLWNTWCMSATSYILLWFVEQYLITTPPFSMPVSPRRMTWHVFSYFVRSLWIFTFHCFPNMRAC